MTTPNRPPVPDWYQQQHRNPRHIGPTQRDLISRRVRSLRQFLIGASVIGVATFTTLAAYHTETKTKAAIAAQATANVQPSVVSTSVASNSVAAVPASTPAQSLFNEGESNGFRTESQATDGQTASYAAAAAPTQSTTSSAAQSATSTNSATQPAATATTVPTPTATTAPQQSTTTQVTSRISSRHRSRTVSS